MILTGLLGFSSERHWVFLHGFDSFPAHRPVSSGIPQNTACVGCTSFDIESSPCCFGKDSPPCCFDRQLSLCCFDKEWPLCGFIFVLVMDRGTPDISALLFMAISWHLFLF